MGFSYGFHFGFGVVSLVRVPLLEPIVEASAGGNCIGPIIGMLGFSLAFTFCIVCCFSGWLNSMPKSGSWLNSVKVVLGFLELALAFKFLSNADLVMQTSFKKSCL